MVQFALIGLLGDHEQTASVHFIGETAFNILKNNSFYALPNNSHLKHR